MKLDKAGAELIMQFEGLSGIYKITSPSGKIYIGQSVNIRNRFLDYFKLAQKQPILYNSFKKHGLENHEFEIAELCDISDLNIKERHYQDLYNCVGLNGLNSRLTGCNDKSGKLNSSVIEKIKNSNIGKKRSSDCIERIRIAKTGTSLSLDSRKKVSENNARFWLGKKRSSATNEKIRLANIGKKYSQETNQKKGAGKGLENHKSRLVMCLESGVYFYTIKEASDSVNLNYAALKAKLCGRNKNNTNLVFV